MKLSYQVPDNRCVRYIVHTDCKNEADDQYTVAHALLTPKLKIKGIIAAHFEKGMGRYAPGMSTKASYDEIIKVMDLMDMSGSYPVLMGATAPMPDENTIVESEGARFIVEEAMKDDPMPLYIGMQGSLTDLACAILMEPEICHRMTAIWIGGADYPKGGQEFNLAQDVAAANVVFKSDMPLWQVPTSVYKNFAVSLAELEYKVAPCGKIGRYLFEQLVELNNDLSARVPREILWPHGELWGLGDEGVIAALMFEEQRTDMYHMLPAPTFDPDTLQYVYDTPGREIRVFDRMDVRLTLEDLFSKLALNYRD